MGMGAVSQWVKRQGREADHSPLFSAEVEKPSPSVLMACYLINET
jgi:hypothetical protein